MYKECQKHLEKVHENYFQHMGFAVCFGFRLIGAGTAAILHGIFPAVFQSTGSSTVFELNDELKKRMSDHHHHD